MMKVKRIHFRLRSLIEISMVKMILSVTIDAEVIDALMEKKRRERIVISNYVESLLRRELGLPPLRLEGVGGRGASEGYGGLHP